MKTFDKLQKRKGSIGKEQCFYNAEVCIYIGSDLHLVDMSAGVGAIFLLLCLRSHVLCFCENLHALLPALAVPVKEIHTDLCQACGMLLRQEMLLTQRGL